MNDYNFTYTISAKDGINGSFSWDFPSKTKLDAGDVIVLFGTDGIIIDAWNARFYVEAV